ncbi:hypothetical protein [Nocardia sp. NBC_00511]
MTPVLLAVAGVGGLALTVAYAISGILGYRELRARPVEVPATG